MLTLLPMPDRDALVHHVRAVLRLMRFDGAAAADLDRSPDGFWQSFGLILLILPVGLFLGIATESLHPSFTAGPEGWSMLGVALLAIVFSLAMWFGFPLLLVPLVRAFRAEAGYGAYVVGRNWSELVFEALLLPVRLVVLATGDMDGFTALLAVVIYVYWVPFNWYLAAVTLRAGALLSTVVVLLNILVTLGLYLIQIELLSPAAAA
ncbi:hypothetical protein [Zavarzinia sp. CC-PAN008]|uniref:hypothetical protein n=1 Tax=Zavarzinia sp. CC-PAN008 TaxID=3243332 RepID=UPI003F749525